MSNRKQIPPPTQWDLARVAAAESSSRDQIRQEMDAAIYK